GEEQEGPRGGRQRPKGGRSFSEPATWELCERLSLVRWLAQGGAGAVGARDDRDDDALRAPVARSPQKRGPIAGPWQQRGNSTWAAGQLSVHRGEKKWRRRESNTLRADAPNLRETRLFRVSVRSIYKPFIPPLSRSYRAVP